MTFTYNDTSIGTDLAKIRLMIGDTVSTNPILTDEEINFFLSETDNIYLAAANTIEKGVLPALAREVDRTGTGFTASRSQKFQHYKDLIVYYRAQASTQAEVGWSELTQSSLDEVNSDSDYIQGEFSQGMHDRDGTSGSSNG